VRYSIEPREGYLLAELVGRDSAEQTREFLLSVHAACRAHRCAKIVIRVRQSRAVFRAEDYGLSGYANQLVSSGCQIALVGDSAELHAAHEYLELVARQQRINVRAFRDTASAERWLAGTPEPSRRYRMGEIALQGAPAQAGIYALWQDDELVYYGRAVGSATIRSRLREHLAGRPARVTHYSWEVCDDPAAREAELLEQYRGRFQRVPRDNAA
jgi:hypothetical protein